MKGEGSSPVIFHSSGCDRGWRAQEVLQRRGSICIFQMGCSQVTSETHTSFVSLNEPAGHKWKSVGNFMILDALWESNLYRMIHILGICLDLCSYLDEIVIIEEKGSCLWFGVTLVPRRRALLLTAAKSYSLRYSVKCNANLKQIFRKIGGCKHMHIHPFVTEEQLIFKS